jgi:hypothetical protein
MDRRILFFAAIAVILIIIAIASSLQLYMHQTNTTTIVHISTNNTTLPANNTPSRLNLPEYYMTNQETSSLFGPGGKYNESFLFGFARRINYTTSVPANSVVNYTVNATLYNFTVNQNNVTTIRAIYNTTASFMANILNWGYEISYNSSNLSMEEIVIVNSTKEYMYHKYLSRLSLLENTLANASSVAEGNKISVSENDTYGGIVYSYIEISNPPKEIFNFNLSHVSGIEGLVGTKSNETAVLVLYLHNGTDFINATQIAAVVSNDLSR